jgi:hypothetical protein
VDAPPRPNEENTVNTPDYPTEVATFALELREAHLVAGKPSYRSLEIETGYSPATITRAMQGKVLPKWDVVKNLLTAFGGTEDEIASWRARWAKIKRMSEPNLAERVPAEPEVDIPSQAAASAGGVGKVCEVCGVPVMDSALHREWHAYVASWPMRAV